jgi:NAD(P)-dependent dehydrogenase (short-subunit alcohol dehydrogenase family)
VNISTGSVHAHHHPAVAARPAYTLSKLSGTLLFQLLAQDHPHEQMQVVSFNPGLIYNEYWKSLDLGPELFDAGRFKAVLKLKRRTYYKEDANC